MTQKARIWRPGNSQSLGHLGHLVIVLKLVAGDVSTCRYSPTKGIPLYKNCQFCFLYLMTQMTQSIEFSNTGALRRLGHLIKKHGQSVTQMTQLCKIRIT